MPRTVVVGALLLVLAGCGGPARSAEDAAPVRASSPALPGADVSATPTASAGGSPSPSPYDPTRDAAADVAAALHEAGADGRPVLLDFGAAWSTTSRWSTPSPRTPSDRSWAGFHLVEIDVGKSTVMPPWRPGTESSSGPAASRRWRRSPRTGTYWAPPRTAPSAESEPDAGSGCRPAEAMAAFRRVGRSVSAAMLLLGGCGGGQPPRQTSTQFSAGGVDVTLTVRTSTVLATLRPEQAGFHVYSVDLPEGGVDGWAFRPACRSMAGWPPPVRPPRIQPGAPAGTDVVHRTAGAPRRPR